MMNEKLKQLIELGKYNTRNYILNHNHKNIYTHNIYKCIPIEMYTGTYTKENFNNHITLY